MSVCVAVWQLQVQEGIVITQARVGRERTPAPVRQRKTRAFPETFAEVSALVSASGTGHALRVNKLGKLAPFV